MNTVNTAFVTGFDHVSTASANVDRLIEFYQRIFGLDPLPGFPITGADGRKIVLIPLPNGTTLQATEVALPGAPEVLMPPTAVFYGTTRFDHASFRATDGAAFDVLLSRLVAEGASTGDVRTFQQQRFFAFTDPDGYLAEVVVNGL